MSSIFGGDAKANTGGVDQALGNLASMGVPTLEAQQLILQYPELVGQLAATTEEAQSLDGSALEQIKANPDLVNAQMMALNRISQRAEQGLAPEDREQLASLMDAARQQSQSQTATTLQKMQERGQGGPQMELAARLAAQQQAQQNAGVGSVARVQMDRQMQQEAAQQQADMATQLQGQAYQEAAARAAGQNQAAQMNAQQLAEAQARNAARQNQVQKANITAAQQQANQKADIMNQQQQYNKELLQTQFQNQLQKAQAQSNLLGQKGEMQQQAAQAGAQNAGSIFGGLSTLAGVGAGAALGGPAGASLGGTIGSGVGQTGAAYSDKNLKENITSGDAKIKEMLDKLAAYEYDYKPEVGEEGKHTSVMAQDLEKSDLGKDLVEEAEMGKMVDYDKATPVLLAADAHLNQRLNAIEKLLGKYGQSTR